MRSSSDNTAVTQHEAKVPFHRLGIIVFLLAMTTRLGYLYFEGWGQWEKWPDSLHYERIAWRLCQGMPYDDPSESPPAIWRPPLLPYIIAVVYWLSGREPVHVQIFLVVLGSCACLAVARATLRMYGSVPAILVGVAVACYPQFIYLSTVFYPESVGVFIIAICFLLLAHSICCPTLRIHWMIALGLTMGLGALCRANWLMSLIVWVPGLIVVRRLRMLRTTALPVLVCMVAWIGSWCPWTLRNYSFYGRPLIMITSSGGGNFYLGNNPDATWNSKTLVRKELDFRGRTPQESERELYLRGWQYMRNNPGRSFVLWCGKLLNYWMPLPSIRDHAVHRGKLAAAAASSAVVLIATVICFYRAVRERDEGVMLLLSVPVLDSLITAAFITPYRLRIPFDTILISLCAAVICYSYDRLRSKL